MEYHFGTLHVDLSHWAKRFFISFTFPNSSYLDTIRSFLNELFIKFEAKCDSSEGGDHGQGVDVSITSQDSHRTDRAGCLAGEDADT